MSNMNIRNYIEKAGGMVPVARACGLTRQAVFQWLEVNRMPLSEITGRTRYAKIIAKMAKENGHNFTPHDLCPGAGQYMQQYEEEAEIKNAA